MVTEARAARAVGFPGSFRAASY